jgi:hypothetical protein
MSMKNSVDTIGNRTHDRPACSTMPQPAALSRAPMPAVQRYSVERKPDMSYGSPSCSQLWPFSKAVIACICVPDLFVTCLLEGNKKRCGVNVARCVLQCYILMTGADTNCDNFIYSYYPMILCLSFFGDKLSGAIKVQICVINFRFKYSI